LAAYFVLIFIFSGKFEFFVPFGVGILKIPPLFLLENNLSFEKILGEQCAILCKVKKKKHITQF
jgi:hypothetical protein